jgi:hypothetical protein
MAQNNYLVAPFGVREASVRRYREVRAVFMKLQECCVSECLPVLRTLVITGIRTATHYFDNYMTLRAIRAT